MWNPKLLTEYHVFFRVAKCHGYDGYIRVKILASWGKSLGEHTILKMKPFLEEICTTYVKCLCLNFHNLTETSTSVLQKYLLCQFWCQNGRDLRAFLRVKFGLTVLTFSNSECSIVQQCRILFPLSRHICLNTKVTWPHCIDGAIACVWNRFS